MARLVAMLAKVTVQECLIGPVFLCISDCKANSVLGTPSHELSSKTNSESTPPLGAWPQGMDFPPAKPISEDELLPKVPEKDYHSYRNPRTEDIQLWEVNQNNYEKKSY